MKGLVVVAGLVVSLGAVASSPRGQDFAIKAETPVSFAKAITIESPVLYPYSIATGDLNGDDIPDLAVVGIEDFRSSHALGEGNGHFGRWSNDGDAGDAPSFVTFADVDLDGHLDMVTSDADRPIVNVAFGNGRGHFPHGRSFGVGQGYATGQVAVADLNGDGIPDLVGTAFGFGSNPGNVFIRMGEGNRKFAKPVNIGCGGYEPLSIAVADVNHDNIPDLVVVNNGRQPPYGNVAVFLGNGDGTFHKPVTYEFGRYKDPTAVTLGDFNGDGNVDMAVTTYHSGAVHILLGRGDGTFVHAGSYTAGLAPHSIVTADFNGDGIPDLAVATAKVAILLGNGDGSFAPPVELPMMRHHPIQLITSDFNADGKPDVGTINGDSTISILLNTTP